jgi:hypothetical protein
MLHQTEDNIIRHALFRLDDYSDDVRRIVTDLFKSGFNDLDELVELAGIARDNILSAQHKCQSAARDVRCR